MKEKNGLRAYPLIGWVWKERAGKACAERHPESINSGYRRRGCCTRHRDRVERGVGLLIGRIVVIAEVCTL